MPAHFYSRTVLDSPNIETYNEKDDKLSDFL